MHPGRNAAAVIHDRDAPIDMDRHLDRLAESRHMFIDAVVDDFIDKVMEAVRTGAADVHRRTLPHGIQAFQHFDLVRAVTLGFRCGLVLVTGHQSPNFTGMGRGARGKGAGAVFPLASYPWP